jgi:hypothetical protein
MTVAVDLVALLFAVRMHWLGGTAFCLPFHFLALVYGPAVAWYVAFPLAIYHLIAGNSKLWALLAYTGMVLLFSAVSLVVLARLLLDGTFVFARGYSMAWDATWGVAQYALALLVFRETLRRRLARQR